MKKPLLILLFATSLFHTSLFTQWVQQTVPVTMPITGIKFIDTSKGWAVTGELVNPLPTDTSSIINTINGGTNWIEQLRAPATEFTDLEVVDANNINVSGYDLNINRMIIYKTINGGLNWSSITMVPNMLINDMQYLNKDSAWECGTSAGPDLRVTTDGGNTWIVRTNGILSATQRIFFLNYNTGFCGAGFSIYKTTNAGLNWLQIANFLRIPTSIFFFNESTGWIGATISTFYKTTNSGINWDTIILSPIFGSITDLQFPSSTRGYGGNRTLRLLITTNSGATWGYQINTTASYRISFLDTNYGWIGDNGISKTINGGGVIIPVGLQSLNSQLPSHFKLYQNFPNPFNPVTTIKIDVPNSSYIKLIIFDILGRELHKEEEYLRTGSYEFKWDASKHSSGTYFYRLITDKYSETKKMILIK